MTGYVVHYSSNGVTNSIPGLPPSATSADITGLTNGRAYSISVEATSEQLSGESETMIISLSECFFSNSHATSSPGTNGLESSISTTLHTQCFLQQLQRGCVSVKFSLTQSECPGRQWRELTHTLSHSHR